MDKRGIKYNLSAALLSQFISLLVGFILSFILPKFLDIYNYSFWQLFLFYATYVGFFHFGINDGVYLRYGGLSFKEMNRNLVSGQFKCLTIIQGLIFMVIIATIISVPMTESRKYVLLWSGIYMIIFNLSNYLGYIFQAANKTSIYSYSILLDKVSYILLLSILIMGEYNVFIIYMIAYVLCKLMSFIYIAIKGKYFVFCKSHNIRRIIEELRKTISVGLKLMLASIASMLILGIGRFFIDAYWSIEIFGKISFALTLTVFVLAFVQQISMVLFPVLRRTAKDEHLKIYNLLCRFSFFVMPTIYILSFPGRYLVRMWLPQYNDSIYYWMILIPIIIFDTQMNLIYNTFFKVYRGEQELLIINLITLSISTISCIVGVYIIHQYLWIVYSMVGVVIFRTILAEGIIRKYIKREDSSQFLYMIIFAVCYLASISCIGDQLLALTIIAICYLLQLLIYQHEFIKFTKDIQLIFKN